MLTQLKKVQQQWHGSHKIIDNWLDERQALLVAYCQLAGLAPFIRDSQHQKNDYDLTLFCQILIDYICAGHFEIFNHQDEKLNHQEDLNLIDHINASTDFALKFNDHYSKITQEDAQHQLAHDLSKLGQFLEQRFSLEDQLIARFHQIDTQ